MSDCVPKSIVKDICRLLAEERASLPESVIEALSPGVDYNEDGSALVIKALADIRAWQAGTTLGTRDGE